MSISKLKQLETFAYWRRCVTATDRGTALWGLRSAIEAKLMKQAPLYALDGRRADLYAEATLAGNRASADESLCAAAWRKSAELSE